MRRPRRTLSLRQLTTSAIILDLHPFVREPLSEAQARWLSSTSRRLTPPRSSSPPAAFTESLSAPPALPVARWHVLMLAMSTRPPAQAPASSSKRLQRQGRRLLSRWRRTEPPPYFSAWPP